MSQVDRIKETAHALARLDVSTSLGLLANERVSCDWPLFTNSTQSHTRVGVWHHMLHCAQCLKRINIIQPTLIVN